jgi:hypothetical protein
MPGATSSALTARFSVAGEPPATALAKWRTTRPAWLPGRYEEIEDSFDSVTWQWRHKQAAMKLIPFSGFFGGATVYRITALFQDDGAGGSRITVNGEADPDTRAAIGAAAESVFEGGIV